MNTGKHSLALHKHCLPEITDLGAVPHYVHKGSYCILYSILCRNYKMGVELVPLNCLTLGVMYAL